ncbi:MAG: PEP-CTERM sorting domain-containing protein [Verrucomicrobiota bacterium]
MFGFFDPGAQNNWLWHDLDYEPIAGEDNFLILSMEAAIQASSNGFNDFFSIQFYNDDTEFLASIGFDMANGVVTRNDGVTNFSVGNFTAGTSQLLDPTLTINLTDNTWTANINGSNVFTDSAFHTGGESLDVGEFDFFWRVTTPGSPGNNFIFADNIVVDATVPEPTTAGIIGLLGLLLALRHRRR